MKKVFLLFLIVNALISYGQNMHFPDETSNYNGLVYYNNTPYTGMLVDMYPNKKHKFETYYKNGLKDGKSTEYFSSGSKQFEGSFVAGETDGKQTYWYENGKVKEITNFVNSKRSGSCKKYFENGQVQLDENYAEGVLDGMKSEWYENGTKRKEVKYFLGNISKYVEWYNNGVKKCEIDYQNGQVKDGDYTFYDENNIPFTVTYAGGVKIKERFKDNHFIGYYNDDNKKDDGFLNINNRIEGKYMSWYPNGQKKSEVYEVDGKFEGKYLEWYENGNPQSDCYYKDNQLQGDAVKYDESGGKTAVKYENGVIVKREMQNDENLISRVRLGSNDFLYYCLSGEDMDTTFIRLTIDGANSSDRYKTNIISAIVAYIDNRFTKIYNAQDFGNRYISYLFSISDVSYSTQSVQYNSKCADKNLKIYDCVRTGYIGICHYQLVLKNANGNVLYNGNSTFKAPDLSDISFSVHYGQNADEAMDNVTKKANAQYAVFHFFPIHAFISELGKVKGDAKVKTVTISVGSNYGVYKGMDFYMSSEDSWATGIKVAKLTITEVNSTTSECKVKEGNEEVFHRFQNGKKVKIISDR
jgi:antitoxin component YwqK of YwqJK toxin-antitoxin module